jgi:hypothetical protein
MPTLVRDRRIVDFAAKHRLSTISDYRSFPEAGALMSYGANARELYRRTADYVDKILKGAKAPDLPVENPTKLELVINRRFGIEPEDRVRQLDKEWSRHRALLKLDLYGRGPDSGGTAPHRHSEERV